MPIRRLRLLLVLALCAGALAGCGRKGSLELPADVQAERAERAKEQAAAKASQKTEFSQEGEKPKEKWVEGDRGHRPPDKYPFFLDPLLQ